MNCVICKHGKTHAGHVTAIVQREGCTVITKDVPAEICDCCGEYYLDAATTRTILARAETAATNGAELEVIGHAS